MFHDASPALVIPALSPTRGSGLGADTDMSGMGAGALVALTDVPDVAHAPRAARPSTSDRGGTSDSRFTGHSGNEMQAETKRSRLTFYRHRRMRRNLGPWTVVRGR